MKFAWLIAAHHRPEHIRRLLDRLLPPGTDDIAVIHADRKSEIWREHREALAAHSSGRVRLVQKPLKVRWGTPSQLVATRLMLDVALAEGCDYYHHMSGVDWPITIRARMVEEIESFSTPPAFIEVESSDQPERMQRWWPDIPRMAEWLPEGRLRANFSRGMFLAVKHGTAVAEKIGVRRSEPLGPWHKGWSWWALPHDLALESRDAIARLERSGRLRGTTIADEHVLPTLMANSHARRVEGYRYFITWNDGSWHPVLLTREHLPELQASDAWFARKFDCEADDFFFEAFPAFA